MTGLYSIPGINLWRKVNYVCAMKAEWCAPNAGCLPKARGCAGARMALDLVGNATDSHPTFACFSNLRPKDKLVLMGSMNVPLSLSYREVMLKEIEIRGAFMLSRDAVGRFAATVTAGTLALQRIELFPFPLDEILAAMERAAQLRGMQHCLVTIM